MLTCDVNGIKCSESLTVTRESKTNVTSKKSLKITFNLTLLVP